MKSDYRYIKDVVYNNFPWPTPTEAQKAKIEQNDRAVMQAYGFDVATTTETSCVAELMRMYQVISQKAGDT